MALWTRRSPWARVLALSSCPTILAIVVDAVVRRGGMLEHGAYGTYALAVVLSAALWGGSIGVAATLLSVGEAERTPARSVPRPVTRTVARVGVVLLFALWIAPLCVFSYGGQALYHRVFHSYMARDTVRYGLALRATVIEWFTQAGGLGLLGVTTTGILLAALYAYLARRASTALVWSRRHFGGSVAVTTSALAILWFDVIDTRGYQPAPPDICFAHGFVHAIRERVRGHRARRELSARTPAPLPMLTRNRGPNVLLIITESVRADTLCSDPPPTCSSRFLDSVISDRIALGKLTTQSPGTVSACVLLWTGLAPSADFATIHAAPTIWEVAKAVGYRTAYVSAQNLKDADFGPFVHRAGIDVRVSGNELGATRYSALTGAPDEGATARTLAFVREVPEGTPWLAVTHLSNTHAPYRVDPALEPFAPHTSLPIGGYEAHRNHYRNSVLLQERTLASFLSELRALPSWADTVVLFLSDHGEQFGEHGGLYHLHTLFDEELRVPGFVVAGDRALGDEQRGAIASFAGARTYTQDVHATMLDLLGVWDARDQLPFAARRAGRSLLRPRSGAEPIALLATSTAVWESDRPRRGVMQGELLFVEEAGGRGDCYDMLRDPSQKTPLPATSCGALVDAAKALVP
jgi:hypothetical protein